MDFGVQGVYESVLSNCFNPLVWRKKNSKFFLPPKRLPNVFGVQNMSQGNGSSAFLFQVTGFLKPVMGSADPGIWLSHSKMVGCPSLYGSNFDF